MDLNAGDGRADLQYARCLGIGTGLAFLLIVAALAAYLSGAVAPHIPLRDLPSLWSLPLQAFLRAADAPTGWSWLSLAGRGDYLNFVGISLLASVTGAAYFCALFFYLRRRDRLYAVLAAAQLLILLAAASGLLN
jgi:hypothetical protein